MADPVLHRPASAPDSLWQLDAARGAAAGYIAVTHIWRSTIADTFPRASILCDFGQEAVIVFFLLSGFVIQWSVARKPGLDFAGYLRARAVRIYPLFLLALFVAWWAAQRQTPPDPRASWPTLLGNIFMLQDWGAIKPGVWVEVYAGVLVLWSLSYEWWFYVIYFPLSKKIPAPMQAWLVAGISVSQLLVYLCWPNPVSRFLLYFSIWWTGVELARARLAGRPLNLRTMAVSLGTLALVAVVLGGNAWRAQAAGLAWRAGVHPVLEFRHFASALALTLGALLWRHYRWAGFRPLFGGFVWIAPFSYALYLLHEPLVLHVGPLAFITNPWLQALSNTLLALTVAWLAEKYFQGWCRRLLLK